MSMHSAAKALLLATGVWLAFSGCDRNLPRGGTPERPLLVRGVTLETTREESIADLIEVTGTVRARNSALIASRIPGTVTGILVREGERAPKGKLLLTIEAAESSAGAAGARAAVEEALRGVEEARARKRLADATFERYTILFREQAVTRQELDGRQMERDVAAEGLARAEARLNQAREAAKAAAVLAGYSRVSAPFSGIVTSKPAELGMTVFPGTPLLTLEEEGRYRLEAVLPESLMGKAKQGDNIGVAIDGIGNLDGKVAEVAPAADPASRTFMVKIDISATGLRSGIFGRAYFPGGIRRGLLVPKSAVVERGALTSVWVVGKDNLARMRLVKAGRSIAGRVEVLTGLSAGERVAVNGLEKVVDGAKVE
jgi:membrane fusion protein, multidrug efflux system